MRELRGPNHAHDSARTVQGSVSGCRSWERDDSHGPDTVEVGGTTLKIQESCHRNRPRDPYTGALIGIAEAVFLTNDNRVSTYQRGQRGWAVIGGGTHWMRIGLKRSGGWVLSVILFYNASIFNRED